MEENLFHPSDWYLYAVDPLGMRNHSHTVTMSTVSGYLVDGVSRKPPFPGTESPQNKIDRLVKEALEKPKIKAEKKRQQEEIERRVELATKLGSDEYEFGTVLKWTRRLGTDTEYTKSTEYRYVAIKAGDGRWYVSGQNQAKAGGWKWDALVEWMITGETTIENLQIATAWEDIF